jgi:hypothetical protein
MTRISHIIPLSIVTAYKRYDSEDNHRLVRDGLHAFSIIPALNMCQYGEHRVNTESRLNVVILKVLYNQRNKDEIIVSVIKRQFGDYLMSRLTRMQNREL